jgi:hypothetical protein
MPLPKVFVSYKRNHEASERVLLALKDELRGVVELVQDQSLAPGARWSRELYALLLECDAGIALGSREANGADWCRREWTLLAARNAVSNLPVFPIPVDGEVATLDIIGHLQALKWSDEAAASLRAALAALTARTRSESDFLAAHHAWLRWQFHESPVFGHEPYALADVYIDTECGQLAWSDINLSGSGNKCDPFAEANGGREDLVRAVLRRIEDENFREPMIVQAAPGSGKSAFALRLANQLLSLGFHPICSRIGRRRRMFRIRSASSSSTFASRVGTRCSAASFCTRAFGSISSPKPSRLR